jgi:hypothetical protein
MERKLLFAIGGSILIGILIGIFTFEKKYYYLSTREPKREITYQRYLDFHNEKQNYAFDYSFDTQIDKEFNTQNAVISGVTAFGIFIIFFSFNKKNKE